MTIRFFICAAALMLCPLTAADDITFSFNEGEGSSAADSSGISAALSKAQWVEGVDGAALLFNGTDSAVTVKSSDALNPGTADFSMAFWMNTTTAAKAHLFGKNGWANSSYSVYCEGENLSVELKLPNPPNKNFRLRTPMAALADGKWHFIACVYVRAGKGTLYVDGRSASSIDLTNPETPVANTADFVIGRGGAGAFSGALDEIRIMKRALSADDIAKEYAARSSRVAVAPVPLREKAAVPRSVLYVAPDGRNTWSGSLASPSSDGKDGPFATLERARDEIRKMKRGGGLPAGGVTVTLRGGSYKRLSAFALDEGDSGTDGSPVVYAAQPGETVRLNGAVPVSGFTAVADAKILERLPQSARGKVLQCDLGMQGIKDYGVIGMTTKQNPSGLELFFDEKPMTLARWPNEGFVRVASAPKGEKGGMFGYYGDEPMRWKDETDARGCGYWAYDWAASHAAFDTIDIAKRVITTKAPHATYGYRKGGRYFAYNLLSEIDMPGEWYLDRRSGILYFWPPADIASKTAEVSMGTGLVTMNNVSYVTVRNIIFQQSRGDAVTITGGTKVSLVGCTLRNLGTRAVVISGGTDHRIAGCDLYDVNEGGIVCSGGDRKTLTPARHVIENNVFTRLARWQRTYVPAVGLSSVGCRVANNLFYDNPHANVLFTGNDNIIEYNEVHSMGYEGGEMGAFYCGRSWILNGNVMRYNYIHDIYNPCPQRNRAFMLDDGAAGLSMYGNLFVRIAEGISLSSYNNVIDRNAFVDCYPAVACWGGRLEFPPFDPKAGHNATMWPPFAELALDKPPWSERFPEMLPLREAFKNGTAVPPQCMTKITGNIIMKGDPAWAGFHVTKDTNAWVIEGNITNDDPFMNAAQGDYRMNPASAAVKRGFNIPFEKMGVYASAERASWPVKHEVRKDMCRDYVYKAPPAPPRAAPLMLKVTRLVKTPVIDGELSDGEWTQDAVSIEQDVGGDVVFSPSKAYFAWDDEAFYAAFSNPVNAITPMALDSVWGRSEAVEAAFRITGRKDAPIMVLRGFAKGSFIASPEAGADAGALKRLANGVSFAAKPAGAALWTCEWRIPFASLGIDSKTDRTLDCNFTVRKVADGLWVMWTGTGGRSWELDKSGRMTLVTAAAAESVLLDDGESGLKWTGKASLSASHAAAGTQSVKFDAGTKQGITLTDFPHNLSACERIVFDCFSEEATGATMNVICASENPSTSGGDYYRATFTVNWKGWKTVTLPFGEFQPGREPMGWNKIDKIDIGPFGWGVEPKPGTVIYIDNFAAK